MLLKQLNALSNRLSQRYGKRFSGSLSVRRMKLSVRVRKGDSVVFTYHPYSSWRYGTVVSFNHKHRTITIIDHAAGGEFRSYKADKIRNFQFWGK
jgi:hypothetical protein